MDKLLYEYKSYIEENSRKNTIMAYMRDVKAFVDEMSIKNSTDLSMLTSENINDYISILKNKGMAYTSIARVVSSLNKFFTFCKMNGIIEDNLTQDIVIPQRQRKLPEIIGVDEVIKILEAPDERTVKGIRDKAMLELVYATGAKVSEIINIKVSDISLKNEVVLFAGEGNHRFAPVGKTAIDAVTKYLKTARSKIPLSDKSDVLFLNFYGEPLTRQGFWKIIKRYIENAGIKGNITAKTLRHSFAIHLLNNGADAQSVSELMGYSDVSSTKIYMEVMNNKIKDVYKKTHPRA